MFRREVRTKTVVRRKNTVPTTNGPSSSCAYSSTDAVATRHQSTVRISSGIEL